MGTSLVDMYAKCECMEDDAQEREQQDAILKCNHLECIVLGHVKCKKYVEGTLNIFNKCNMKCVWIYFIINQMDEYCANSEGCN